MKYIALLRGINVRGKYNLPMADLRALCERLGWQHVQTYIQSGNLKFELVEESPSAAALSVAIKEDFGYEVPILLRPQHYFGEALRHPFLEQGAALDEKTLQVTFLEGVPEAYKVVALQEKDHKEDRFVVVQDRVYLHCPNGYGRTKLTNNYLERHLGQTATTRNWRTLNKLATWK